MTPDQDTLLTLITELANDVSIKEGLLMSTVKCHKSAALLVTFLHDGDCIGQVDGSGSEATFAADLKVNAGNLNVYICSCGLNQKAQSHSWVVVTCGGSALHCESNAPDYSLKQWMAGTAVEVKANPVKTKLSPARWISATDYAAMAADNMNDLTGCESPRLAIAWSRYKVNKNLTFLSSTPQARRYVLAGGAKRFEDHVLATYGGG